ncbi:mll7978 [Mesorhizobium japonicum MAFF 303099]|uniref:Mll7978 protein n=1 Tax=Mesorhizobium japonicum (strain LMG 29417 / CECT 9101 / MAFF 303099) TaxID=266835 RepID=Q984J5_RHILO|nr:mll7978 [Mesorhizobium japonicum MAFF 303099]
MTIDVSRGLRIEAEAAKRLLAQLQDAGHGGDTDLAADIIEGETSLHETVAAAIDQIDNLDVMVIGLKAKEEAFADRRKSIEARAENLRAAIEQAMIAAEQVSIPLPSATVFISKRKPALFVENEADIPSEFFVEQERPAPKLDKRALAAALAGGRKVPGAALDNGTVSLSIRRK